MIITFPRNAFADIYELDKSYGDIPYGLFSIPANNADINWNNVNGKSNGNVLAVPSKGSNGGWEYNNFLDITYKNVGTIHNKQVDLTIHFDKLTVATTGPGKIDSYFEFASLGSVSIWITNSASSYSAIDNKQFYLELTAEVTYSDTGKVVEFPIFLRTTDIDVMGINKYFIETFKPLKGFNGAHYTFKNNALSSTEDYLFKADGSAEFTSGTDELYKCGVISTSNNGEFSFMFEAGNRIGDGGIGFQLYSEREIIDPNKYVVITK